jgi:hypothetical protein
MRQLGGDATGEGSPIDEFRRSRNSMWRMRWALVGLSGLLAAVLIASGAVVIGIIIGVMAVVRAVLIMRFQRHQFPLRQRYRGNPPGS